MNLPPVDPADDHNPLDEGEPGWDPDEPYELEEPRWNPRPVSVRELRGKWSNSNGPTVSTERVLMCRRCGRSLGSLMVRSDPVQWTLTETPIGNRPVGATMLAESPRRPSGRHWAVERVGVTDYLIWACRCGARIKRRAAKLAAELARGAGSVRV